MAVSRVFLVGLVACLATLASGNLIEEESRKLAETIGDLEQVFSNTMKRIFWSNKVQADYLVQSGRQLEGKELLNTAQVAGFIESVKYAIKHKALSVVRDSIRSRFVDKEAVLYDKRTRSNIRPGMLTALVSRVILRSYIDADRFAAFYWGKLFKVLEHNLAAFPANKEFKILAVNTYQQMLQLNIDAKRARQEFERVLRDSLRAMDIDELQSPHIVALLDQMIEDMLQCRTCANAQPDAARLNTKPMFDGEPAIMEAVDGLVDREIQEAFVELEGVYEPSAEEERRVTKQHVEQLMQRLIDGL